jgi:hypothetical protein
MIVQIAMVGVGNVGVMARGGSPPPELTGHFLWAPARIRAALVIISGVCAMLGEGVLEII